MPGVSTQSQDAQDIFVKVDEPWMGYDYMVQLPIAGLGIHGSSEQKKFHQKAENAYNILKRGLDDRLIHLNIVLPKTKALDLNPQTGCLQIGIVAEPSVALRAVDRGPPPEDEAKCREFRLLWGSKAELRRFKDGAILESVVWSGVEAPDILHEIVAHLLTTHLGKDSAKRMKLVGNDFSSVIPGFTPKLAQFDSVQAAYRTLEQEIRALDGLPLSIRQIRPASPAISFASLHLPYAAKGRLAKPMDVTLQFEASARWPDELEAIQMTKLAFLLKLNELLLDQRRQLTSRVGLENEHSDLLNRAFLEVAYPTGLAFRVRIHHDREQTLLERLVKSKELRPDEREAAANALAYYKVTFEKRPTHCQALQAIATRHPALSATIRLLKKWFNAHLLGPHFPEELIEIMAIRSFVHSHPWKPPSSPQTGFLRTLLFLSRWSWEDTPLLADFDGNASSAELSTAHTRFEAWRKVDPAMNRVVLFAATNLDTDGNTWTDRSPTKVVANRMTSLAQAALSSVARQGTDLDVSRLFVPSLKGYDFRIKFSKAFLPSKKPKRKNAQFKNLQEVIVTDNTHAGFDPVESFIAELRLLYSEVMVLFYDCDGGQVIAGIWDPSKQARRWKVNLPYSTVPSVGDEEPAQAVPNREGILSEIARLGGDMLESIETTS